MTKRSSQEILQAQDLLIKNLALQPSEEPDGTSREKLIQFIKPVIQDWLDHDMERLLLVAYRIDVNEQEFRKVLSTEKPALLSTTIAKLIVDRTLQKIKTRAKYSS